MIGENLMARNLMTSDVRTVTVRDSLAKALALMEEGDFDQVPVMEGAKPVGLLTESDIRRALLDQKQEAPVGELASPLPALLTPETMLSEVLSALQAEEAVFVADDTGSLVGIITYWDVLVLGRPFLVLTEGELLLRQVVAAVYEQKYGPNWWGHVRDDLRERAEQEHRNDRGDQPATPEHMLGHTSLWALIEILREARPDIPEDRYEALHLMREYRNRTAHHYIMTPAEVTALIEHTEQVRDWLLKLRRSLES